MDAANSVQCGFAFRLRAEGQREHGPNGLSQARDCSRRTAPKSAVLGHTRSNQWVCELEKNRSHPCQQQQTLGVDAARYVCCWTHGGQCRVGAGRGPSSCIRIMTPFACSPEPMLTHWTCR